MQGPHHEFQGGGAKFYKSNLNLVLQNRAPLEMLLFTKKVGDHGPPAPPPPPVAWALKCKSIMVSETNNVAKFK